MLPTLAITILTTLAGIMAVKACVCMRVERALRRSEELNRLVVGNVSDAVFLARNDGSLVHACANVAGIFGYSRHEIMALGNVQAALGPGAPEPAPPDSGDTGGMEHQIRDKAGHRHHLLVKVKRVRYLDASMLYVCRDITERRQVELEIEDLNSHLEDRVWERTQELRCKTRDLELANERLLDLDAMKSAFLATVSHDIRTPLTSIMGFAKLVDRDFKRHFLPMALGIESLSRRGRKMISNLAVIGSEGERLTRLINDYLDLARMEEGRQVWEDRPVDMGGLLRDMGQAVSGFFFNDSQVRLVIDVQEGLPERTLDPDRMAQVLVNLLSNAAKFTSSGQVTLSGACAGGGVRITVSDTGCGIAPQDLKQVFDRFYQVRGDTASPRKGTGIGLTICRQIVEHYGGGIRVESELGRGSAFIIDLP